MKTRQLLVAFLISSLVGILTAIFELNGPGLRADLRWAGFENPAQINLVLTIGISLISTILSTAVLYWIMGRNGGQMAPPSRSRTAAFGESMRIVLVYCIGAWIAISMLTRGAVINRHETAIRQDFQSQVGYMVYSQVGSEVNYVDAHGNLQAVKLERAPEEITVLVDPLIKLAHPQRAIFIRGEDLTRPIIETWITGT